MYVLNSIFKSIFTYQEMSIRKATARRQQRPVKRRLLDEVTPRTLKDPTITTHVLVDLVTDGSQSQSANGTVTASSSMLKRLEDEVEKDQKLSPDPTLPSQQQLISERQQEQQLLDVRDRFLFHINFDKIVSLLLLLCKIPQPVSANSPFFYSPMYRRCFSLTPPNPRLYNPRSLEDYIVSSDPVNPTGFYGP